MINMAKKDWRVEVGVEKGSHLKISFLCFSAVVAVGGEVDLRRVKILSTALRRHWRTYLTERQCDLLSREANHVSIAKVEAESKGQRKCVLTATVAVCVSRYAKLAPA